MTYVLILFLLPFIGATLVFYLSSFTKAITIATTALLALTSVLFYIDMGDSMSFSTPLKFLFTLADFALIFYFIKEGFKHSNPLVWIFGFVQLGLLTFLKFMGGSEGADFFIDHLSAFMFILINLVGGLIAIYALEYIKDEEFSESRKRGFIAILLAFLGVMNLAVSANSLELFFLFFELTTLASYLLISYRKDDISIKNGLKALWMNEIGGVALLVGTISVLAINSTIYISDINALPKELISALPLAFLSIAAFVKGAQIPFNGWLLGAMVAPTPVSAMLHSATMVKIAPYFIARLSPAISSSAVMYMVILLGGFTFLAAAILALEKDKFKEILAYSTISLLGMMIALSAFGSTYAIMAVLMTIGFHGVAKAYLFLQAGIYEKKFHAKTLDKLQGIALKSPRMAFFTMLGFASITLPPFGAFLAKWYSREIVADMAYAQFFVVYMITALTLASALLSVLYFRVGGVLLPKSGATFGYERLDLGRIYSFCMYAFTLILAVSAVYIFELINDFFYLSAYAVSFKPIAIAIEGSRMYLPFTSISMYTIIIALFIIFIPFIAFFIHLKGVDRAKEYSCGEEVEFHNHSYFLKLSDFQKSIIYTIGGMLFVATITVGLF
jgi:ech hydrogenase subunit A